MATCNILNSLFDKFDICAFLHEQARYSYFVKECPLRLFPINTQNFDMLQNLKCKAFGVFTASGIFVICMHLSKKEKQSVLF